MRKKIKSFPYTKNGNEFDTQKDYEDEFQYGDEFDVPSKSKGDEMPDPPPDWKRESENEFDIPKDKSWWENLKDKIILAHGGLMEGGCSCGMPECMTCSTMMDHCGL